MCEKTSSEGLTATESFMAAAEGKDQLSPLTLYHMTAKKNIRSLPGNATGHSNSQVAKEGTWVPVRFDFGALLLETSNVAAVTLDAYPFDSTYVNI